MTAVSQPYLNDTYARIADRNARSKAYLDSKNAITRPIARAGLGIANTLDRATAFATDEYFSAFRGVLGGAFAGGVWGIALGIAAIALTGGAATGIFGWMVLGGAVFGALKQGIHNYKTTVNSGRKRDGAQRANLTGELTGALPGLVEEATLKVENEQAPKLSQQIEGHFTPASSAEASGPCAFAARRPVQESRERSAVPER